MVVTKEPGNPTHAPRIIALGPGHHELSGACKQLLTFITMELAKNHAMRLPGTKPDQPAFLASENWTFDGVGAGQGENLVTAGRASGSQKTTLVGTGH